MDAALETPAVAQTMPLIELTDVRRTYVTGTDLAVEALRGVSLTINAGEFVAIMGASGSGKSTLMHLIGCLDRPNAGSYRFAGRDLAALDRDDRARLRREAFGFVFQSYHLIPTATALENVEIPAMYAGLAPDERRRRAAKLLDTMGLGDRMFHRPNQLSGGQQQRVAIARALMNGGRVILADEPTGALDSRSGAELMALLRQLAARGHTIILITHDRDVASHAERVIELRDGEIIGDTRKAAIDAPARLTGAPAIPTGGEGQGRARFFGESFEAAKTALRALRVNLFRTVLTLLGIVIGVASVITMLSIGEGAKQAVIKRIGSMGTNLLMVRARSYNRRLAPGAQSAVLMPEDADIIAQLPNVRSAMPENRGNVTIRAGNVDDQTRIYGTTPQLPETRNWTVRVGTFFDWDDLRSYAPVAVLGQNVADTLFPRANDPVGRYILINNIPFQVVGVLASKGSVSGDEDDDDVVFVPLTTAGLRLFGRRDVRMITVAVEDIGAMDATQQAITQLLKTRHGNQEFRIYNMLSWLQTASEAQNTLTLLLGSIAAISLLVGGIGVMNIMLVTVTERTREIGIRMATGARTRDILQQFLIEAMVVSGLGGVAGVAVGIGAGIAVRSFDMPTVFSPATVGLAFGCAAAAGLLFGFIPAWRASRLDPVAALASE